MQIFTFNFNTHYVDQFRQAVADSFNRCIDIKHNEKKPIGEYSAWDRTCVIMDRLEDTLNYLNSIELGHCANRRSAFDFYDFINNCFVVINCIKTLGRIFRLDENYINDIENSNSVFGNELSLESKDERYFEYIRSLTSVHPLETNRQPMFLNGNTFHCCPFVTWNGSFAFTGRYQCDLEAWIYTSKKESSFIIVPLYISQFECYVNKWIELIPTIIEAKNNYANEIESELRKKPVRPRSDFDNIVAYLTYLKNEYCNRIGDYCDSTFDAYIRIFKIKLTDKRNNKLLDKYKNAIIYSLKFLNNELQNLSCEGYKNSGIKYPDTYGENTLFCWLDSISVYEGAFSKYSYELSKIYDLELPNSVSQYARWSLENSKELMEQINHYVFFTNKESNEEVIVLVNLALYLESLTRKCPLNQNIPKFKKYRTETMSEGEYEQLFSKDMSLIDEKDLENTLEETLRYIERMAHQD